MPNDVVAQVSQHMHVTLLSPKMRMSRAPSLRYVRSLARAWLTLGVLGCGGDADHDSHESTTAGAAPAAGASGMHSAANSGTHSAAGSGMSSVAGSGTNSAGTGGTMAGSGGQPNAGSSGVAGRPAPAGGSGGGAGQAGAMSGGGTGGASSGPAARFSFFVTSQAGLAKLAGNPNGFGGNLKLDKADGLSGADEICRRLAETTAPGNGKTWRAFLSVTKGPDGKPVNAIDRVGEGPWYDRLGRMFAANKAALISTRPQGADPLIIDDFPNEEGVPNHDPGTGIIDNHNMLTGSDTMGKLDAKGLMATCQDWTSSAKEGGKPRCGVSWPRGQLTHWISVLNEGGCVPGTTPPGAEAGPQNTVGALGGYGGFYCFALTP